MSYEYWAKVEKMLWNFKDTGRDPGVRALFLTEWQYWLES